MNREPVTPELDDETLRKLEKLQDALLRELGLFFTREEVAQFVIDKAVEELPDDPQEAGEVILEQMAAEDAESGEVAE